MRELEDSKIIDTGKDNVEDLYNALADDDESEEDIQASDDLEEKDEKTEAKETEEAEEKEDKEEEDEELELKEAEEEEEEEETEELEDDEFVVPVRRKEVLAKYPQVFKDFPYLEKSLYISQQFTELFPTPDDAKQAKEALGQFSEYETALVENADARGILKAVKESDPESPPRS